MRTLFAPSELGISWVPSFPTAEELAEIRREILAGLDPVQRERALAAEARVGIDDQEIDQALLRVSRRLLAEKRAEIAEGKQSRDEEE